MQLTRGAVTGLKSTKPDQVFWDDSLPGFGVRLRGGKKSWIIQYRINKKQRRESLGDIRCVSLDDARSIARKRFAAVELGLDPAADKAKAAAAAMATQRTVGFLTAAYLDSRASVVRASTLRDMRRYFDVAWKPLRGRPADSATQVDVAAQLQVIKKDSGPVSAKCAKAYLSASFSWGMREGLCTSNPAIGCNDPAKGIRPRERVLAISELTTIWRAAGDDDFGHIIRLLILIPYRRQEIGSLLWTDIDFETGTVVIPGARTKNGRTLELVLPDKAIEILETTPRRGDHVFGAKGTGFTSWAISMAALRRRITMPMAEWGLHRFRRSA